MSATNRGAKIIAQEFYPTPEYTTNSLLKELDWSKVTSFREPCRGDGHIYDLINVPIKDYFEISEGKDYLANAAGKVDLIITNPPFSLAQEFIVKARSEAATTIILQRLNYLGSKTRKDFWNSNPPTHLFVLANRPKFIAKCSKCSNSNNYQIGSILNCPMCGSKIVPKNDATEYAWFVWDHNNIVIKEKGVYVI